MIHKTNAITTPRIMGVVNVTPDSFSDGGVFDDHEAAIAHGRALIKEGADILDIGGESTRPGADFVSVDEECARILPVIERLATETDALISVDTRKPETARAAIAAGAAIWNDVSALSFAPDAIETAAALGCDVVLMHAKGDPKTMQERPAYKDVVSEVYAYLESRIEACVAAGMMRERIMIDPGIGFGKTLDHNLALLAQLQDFSQLAPVLLGVSRKSFIAAIDEEKNGRKPAVGERLGGSIAAILAARGACVLRVHDVAATRQALAVFQAISEKKNLTTIVH